MNRWFTLFVLIGIAAACNGNTSGEGTPDAGATAGKKPPPAELVWPDAPPPSLEHLKGGVSEQNRQGFYHMGEGSEFFPLTWFLALPQENGEPFIKNLGRYGLIPDRRNDKNPAGLPIGLTNASLRGMPNDARFVGVNCAACHVGQIQSSGKMYVVDGAPNLFNVEKFFAETLGTFLTFFKHPSKLWAFHKRASEYAKALQEPIQPDDGGEVKSTPTEAGPGGDDPRLRDGMLAQLDKTPDFESLQKGDDVEKALAEEIQKAVDEYSAQMGDQLKAEGIARRDMNADIDKGVGAIRSKVPTALPDRIQAAEEVLADIHEGMRLFAYRLAFYWNRYRADSSGNTPGGYGRTDAWGTVRSIVYDNKAPANAPICYPHLWGFSRDKYLHWIANTGSVMQRNIGQAIGLTAIVDMKNYKSTVDVANLDALEVWAYEIQPPRWSDTNLPPIDETKKAQGAKTFQKLCAGCHEKQKVERREGREWLDLNVTPKVGTDQTTLVNFNKPVQVDGADTPLPRALYELLGKVQAQAYKDANVPEATQKAWEHGRGWINPLWRDAKGYIARPLAGIWATAPYLHNGSVPTLDALLRPSGVDSSGKVLVASTKPESKTRPKEFGIGAREFDPKHVGYVDSPDKAYRFDTTVTGNGNAGHEGREYGTELTETERENLIEYLKSL